MSISKLKESLWRSSGERLPGRKVQPSSYSNRGVWVWVDVEETIKGVVEEQTNSHNMTTRLLVFWALCTEKSIGEGHCQAVFLVFSYEELSGAGKSWMFNKVLVIFVLNSSICPEICCHSWWASYDRSERSCQRHVARNGEQGLRWGILRFPGQRLHCLSTTSLLLLITESSSSEVFLSPSFKMIWIPRNAASRDTREAADYCAEPGLQIQQKVLCLDDWARGDWEQGKGTVHESWSPLVFLSKKMFLLALKEELDSRTCRNKRKWNIKDKNGFILILDEPFSLFGTKVKLKAEGSEEAGGGLQDCGKIISKGPFERTLD